MMLKHASNWLDNQRQKHLTIPVSYKRSTGEVLELNATIGSTMFKAVDDYGITVITQSRDFLILANDLPTIPQKGETIICDNYRFEVLAPNGEPVWRWSGNHNTTYRIHTKGIGVSNG